MTRVYDSREESKLYQNVEDVKTFNSEVHEYEYYPYESYGKQVSYSRRRHHIFRECCGKTE